MLCKTISYSGLPFQDDQRTVIFNDRVKYKQGYPLIDSQVTPMIFLVNTLFPA